MFHGLNGCLDAEPVSISHQFFYAEFCNSAVHEIAHIRLVVVKDHCQSLLSDFMSLYYTKNYVQQISSHPQFGCLRMADSEVIEDIALNDCHGVFPSLILLSSL
jgi:hypothetical protein